MTITLTASTWALVIICYLLPLLVGVLTTVGVNYMDRRMRAKLQFEHEKWLAERSKQ